MATRFWHPYIDMVLGTKNTIHRMSIVIDATESGTEVGFSICSPKDQFVKKTGRDRALSMLYSNPLRIKNVDFRQLPSEARRMVLIHLLRQRLDTSKTGFPASATKIWSIY